MQLSPLEIVRRSGKVIDVPGAVIGHASGGKFAPMNFLPDAFDRLLGQGGASQGERLKGLLSAAEMEGINAGAVYDSLTPAEVQQLLGNRDDNETRKFILDRWKQLQQKRGR